MLLNPLDKNLQMLLVLFSFKTGLFSLLIEASSFEDLAEKITDWKLRQNLRRLRHRLRFLCLLTWNWWRSCLFRFDWAPLLVVYLLFFFLFFHEFLCVLLKIQGLFLRKAIVFAPILLLYLVLLIWVIWRVFSLIIVKLIVIVIALLHRFLFFSVIVIVIIIVIWIPLGLLTIVFIIILSFFLSLEREWLSNFIIVHLSLYLRPPSTRLNRMSNIILCYFIFWIHLGYLRVLKLNQIRIIMLLAFRDMLIFFISWPFNILGLRGEIW